MAVVVRPPDVDDPFVPPDGELVVVVGDIRRKVGGDAVLAHQNLVLFPAKAGGPVPDGPLLPVDGPHLLQLLDDRLNGLRVELAFQEPPVKINAVGVQVVL